MFVPQWLKSTDRLKSEAVRSRMLDVQNAIKEQTDRIEKALAERQREKPKEEAELKCLK